jgi:hypothetical protein
MKRLLVTLLSVQCRWHLATWERASLRWQYCRHSVGRVLLPLSYVQVLPNVATVVFAGPLSLVGLRTIPASVFSQPSTLALPTNTAEGMLSRLSLSFLGEFRRTRVSFGTRRSSRLSREPAAEPSAVIPPQGPRAHPGLDCSPAWGTLGLCMSSCQVRPRSNLRRYRDISSRSLRSGWTLYLWKGFRPRGPFRDTGPRPEGRMERVSSNPSKRGLQGHLSRTPSWHDSAGLRGGGQQT